MVSSGSSLLSSVSASALPARALIQMHTAGMSGYHGNDLTSSRAPSSGVSVCGQHIIDFTGLDISHFPGLSNPDRVGIALAVLPCLPYT